MANVNVVILIGNLTRDPQLRYTASQAAVCEFGLAINRRWKGADGQQKEEVCFVDCTAWGKQAETLQKYVAKGQPLYVQGRLTYQAWEKDGQKRSKLLVTVEQFQFLGGRERTDAPSPKEKDAPLGLPTDMPPDEDIPF